MITSEANQQIKEIIKLQKQPKYRHRTFQFVIEGLKMLSEAAESKCLKKLYISGSVMEKAQDMPKWLLEKYPYEIVSDRVFQKISDTVTTQGILGIAELPEYNIETILEDNKHMWLLLDRMRDPGNLGTVLRTAEGAGMSAVIMGKGTVDLFNPKTIRSTMGAVFRMPFVYADDLVDIIKRIKNNGYNVYGMAMRGSVIYDEPDYTKGAGIVIGSEADGLSENIQEYISGAVRIPMEGRTESLNAATAAAVVMYEAARQRRRKL
ncbi:MAG TPA: hypothetical protein DCZ23_06445 [Lachnospiraceae bacterium]|nr:hypothetical protein [Lachnospiraceae bacterium]